MFAAYKRHHGIKFDPFNIEPKEKKIQFDRLGTSVKTKPFWWYLMVFIIVLIIYWYLKGNL